MQEELEKWLEGRPEVVKDLARRFPPWKTFVNKETGQLMQTVAFSEDGTIRANCWQEWCPELTAVQVFGLSPDDFEDKGGER